MGKYEPLGDYLRRRPQSEVPLSFAEIEQIIGARLPPKAQGHRAWWSNNPSNNVMTQVWLDAGYQTERVDVVSRKLVFRRRPDIAPPPPPASAAPALDIKVHPAFGGLKGLIHIQLGYDLAQPTGEAWDAALP